MFGDEGTGQSYLFVTAVPTLSVAEGAFGLLGEPEIAVVLGMELDITVRID